MWKQKATYRSSMPIHRRKTLAPGAKKGYTTPCGAGNSRGIGGRFTCVGGRVLEAPCRCRLILFSYLYYTIFRVSFATECGTFFEKNPKIGKRKKKRSISNDLHDTIYCSEVGIIHENLQNNEKISKISVDRTICLAVNYIRIKVIILLPLGRMSSSRSRLRDLSTLTL